MSQAIDRTGHRYGRWTVLRQAESRNGRARWLCLCDCGTRREVRASALVKSNSCGCYAAERAREPKRQAHSEPETWVNDSAWPTSRLELDWIRRPIRREAA